MLSLFGTSVAADLASPWTGTLEAGSSGRGGRLLEADEDIIKQKKCNYIELGMHFRRAGNDNRRRRA